MLVRNRNWLLGKSPPRTQNKLSRTMKIALSKCFLTYIKSAISLIKLTMTHGKEKLAEKYSTILYFSSILKCVSQKNTILYYSKYGVEI